MTKRSRSPLRSPEPQRGGPHRAKRCDLHCRRASDARRIAELEAEVDEMRGQMAALEAAVGVDLHDCDEVRALRAAQHRNGGGSGFGHLHVRRESGHRLSEALLEAVCAETERLKTTTSLDPVGRTALARWTMPHSVVPWLVARHVVAPFVEPDWVVSGPGAPRTAVLNGAEVTIATFMIRLLLQSNGAGEVEVRDCPLDKLCGRSVELTGDELRRFVGIIEPFTRDWPALAFLHGWFAVQVAETDECSAAAAGRVFASAAHAADWRCFCPDPPTKRNTLIALAALATTPDHVIALCCILRHSDTGQGGGRAAAGAPDAALRRGALCNIRHNDVLLGVLDEELWTGFFCCLAPRATTAAAAEALCDAAPLFFKFRGFAMDSIARFFVALVPAIDSYQTIQSVSAAFHHVTGNSLNYPLPGAFYDVFFLPLARRATTLLMVDVLNRIFVTTFADSWAVGDELPPILAQFVSIVVASQRLRRCPLSIEVLVAVFALIARNSETVALASGMVDTVAVPLASLTLTIRHQAYTARELREALTAVVAYRSNSGDASGGREVKAILGRLNNVGGQG